MEKCKHNELERRYDFMIESVQNLGKQALYMTKGEITMSRKPDGSKVTSADQALNDEFIRQVEAAFPADLVWGEERSNSEKGDLMAANRQWMWLIDPIDGTNGFWRAYQNQRFSDCTSTVLIAGFAPGETAPTVSTAYNPFQKQTLMLSADPNGAYQARGGNPRARHLKLDSEAVTQLSAVNRYEGSSWGDGLKNMHTLFPDARLVSHQVFMASIALKDVDIAAFSAPSHPHDVAANAHIAHQAGAAVHSLKGEMYDEIDWRVDPIAGVIAAATPELANEFLQKTS